MIEKYKMTRQGVRDLSDLFGKKSTRIVVEIPTNKTPQPQIFKLYRSYDCGMHYDVTAQGTEEELLPLMTKYDKESLRWYTEEINEQGSIHHCSKIHKALYQFVEQMK